MSAKPENERERIARIIEPDEWMAIDRARSAFDHVDDYTIEQRCKRSLAKADTILTRRDQVLADTLARMEELERCVAWAVDAIDHLADTMVSDDYHARLLKRVAWMRSLLTRSSHQPTVLTVACVHLSQGARND